MALGLSKILIFLPYDSYIDQLFKFGAFRAQLGKTHITGTRGEKKHSDPLLLLQFLNVLYMHMADICAKFKKIDKTSFTRELPQEQEWSINTVQVLRDFRFRNLKVHLIWTCVISYSTEL